MLWVSEGKKRWHETPPGVTGATSSNPAVQSARSCSGCHGEIERSMSGVAARYPAWDTQSGEPVNLQRRINLCRERHQSMAPLASEDDTMLALEAAIASGVLSISVDGQSTTFASISDLRKVLRAINDEIATCTGQDRKRPRAAQVYLGGFA